MTHPYHMVDHSPWPIMSSFSALIFVGGFIQMLISGQSFGLWIGLIAIIFASASWWLDVSIEGSFLGLHTISTSSGLRWGMALFIISECLFFFSFFWAYFHSSMSPCAEIGAAWPPTGIDPFNPFSIPLLNTLILLTSGASVTWCHFAVMGKMYQESVLSLSLTVALGTYFLGLQWLEYNESSFTMSDSVYGSSFFIMTGFHGFHVLVGTLFLGVNLSRLLKNHFSSDHHVGLESAAWYWHFVDVVWLFLFISVYWWSWI